MKHSAAFLRLVEQARSQVRETDVLTVARRQERGEPFHLIDVREDSEWRRGHVPGAVHIGRGILERDIEARIPDMDAEIVLYCGGGYRSVLAAEALQKMGYTRVSSVAGGWRDWQEAGLPVDVEA